MIQKTVGAFWTSLYFPCEFLSMTEEENRGQKRSNSPFLCWTVCKGCPVRRCGSAIWKCSKTFLFKKTKKKTQQKNSRAESTDRTGQDTTTATARLLLLFSTLKQESLTVTTVWISQRNKEKCSTSYKLFYRESDSVENQSLALRAAAEIRELL